MEKYDFADINNESIPDIVVLQEDLVVRRVVLSDAEPYHYTPIYYVTAFFATILLLSFLFVRKGKTAGVTRTCLMLAAFYMWLLWVTVYIAQINPLMSPLVENSTLAWLSYKGPMPEDETPKPPPTTPFKRGPIVMDCTLPFDAYSDCGYTYRKAAMYPQFLFSHAKYGHCNTPKYERCQWYITWPTKQSKHSIRMHFQHISLQFTIKIHNSFDGMDTEWIEAFVHLKFNNKLVGKYSSYNLPKNNMFTFTPNADIDIADQNISLYFDGAVEKWRFPGFQLEYRLLEP